MIEDGIPIRIDNIVQNGNEIWCVDVTTSSLFVLDGLSNELQYKKWLSHEVADIFHKYLCAGMDHGHIILAPEHAGDVLVYDCATEEIKSILLPVSEDELRDDGIEEPKFRTALTLENSIWVFPQSCHKILEWNMVNATLRIHEDWYRPLEQYGWKGISVFGRAICARGSVWMPCREANIIVEFSTRTKKSSVYEIDGIEYIPCIAYCNDTFWLWDNENGALVKWMPEEGTIDYIEMPTFEKAEGNYTFKMIAIDRTLLLLPCRGDEFLLFHTEDKTWKTLGKKPDGGNYITGAVLDDAVICFSQTNDQHMLLNRKTGDLTRYHFKSSKKDRWVYSAESMAGQGQNPIFIENEADEIAWFMEWSMDKSMQGVYGNNEADSTIGTCIFKDIKVDANKTK